MTPRTDAEAVEVLFTPDPKHPGSGFGLAVPVEFARELERECDSLRMELAKLRAEKATPTKPQTS